MLGMVLRLSFNDVSSVASSTSMWLEPRVPRLFSKMVTPPTSIDISRLVTPLVVGLRANDSDSNPLRGSQIPTCFVLCVEYDR